MGAAAYNRGSARVAMYAEQDARGAIVRADVIAYKDEAERLRERIADLETDLARARRCLASERLGRESLRLRLAQADQHYRFAVGILTKLAFSSAVKESLTVHPEGSV